MCNFTNYTTLLSCGVGSAGQEEGQMGKHSGHSWVVHSQGTVLGCGDPWVSLHCRLLQCHWSCLRPSPMCPWSLSSATICLSAYLQQQLVPHIQVSPQVTPSHVPP